MHHCINYMYINFQQSHVSRSVKTVYTNLFSKNRKYKHPRGDVDGDVDGDVGGDVEGDVKGDVDGDVMVT